MKVSTLKHELQIMELQHRHQLDIIKLKQEQEKKLLLDKCKHTYDDGSSAKIMEGVQWNHYHKCSICNKSMS